MTEYSIEVKNHLNSRHLDYINGLMESRVVLICLKPYLSPSQINEKTLYTIFSQFAQVTSVSIFACTSVLKAFVEFETPAIAWLAVDYFNGRQFNFGSVHVYPSNKLCIRPKPTSSISHKSSSQTPTSLLDDPSSSKKSETFSIPEQRADSSANHLLLGHNASCIRPAHDIKSQNNANLSDFLSLESDLSKPSRQTPFDPVSHRQHIRSNKYIQKPWPTQPTSRTCLEDNGALSYVQITGLNPHIVNSKILMNLTCCFGNVKRIHYKQSEGLALVLYSSDLESATAVHYLSSLRFFSATTESKDSLLTCTEIENYDFERNGFLTIDGKKQDFRYNSSLRIKFNSPSSILHFTNLPDSCTAPILYHILCAIQEPLKIMRLARRNSKEAGMMLVEFENPSKALEVLSVMHNKKINENIIRVSFSQTRISQYS